MVQSLAMLALLLTIQDLGVGPQAVLFFEPGSTALLSENDRGQLDRFPGDFIEGRNDRRWVVVICAGREDGSESARRLARARARMVGRRLAERGVAPIELWGQRRCREMGHMDKASVLMMTQHRWREAERAGAR